MHMRVNRINWEVEMVVLLGIGGAGSTVGAIVALWRGSGTPVHGRAFRLLAAALAIASASCWIAGFGAEIGIPLLLEVWALVGFAFILTRLERRPDRAARDRVLAGTVVERRIMRGVAQVTIAGPLGFAAAIGIAAAIATRAPFAEQTRLIGAGLLVPSLWAGCVGWTLMARRLPVPAAGMTLLAGIGFGLALLGRG